MDPLLFLSALRARLGLFGFALGVTVAAAIALSVLMPETYRATASLVIDTRQEQSLSTVLDVLASPSERTAYIQTQVDIITSPTVARRVVEELRLTERPSVQEDYEDVAGETRSSIEEWLAGALLENLEVETTQSSVVALSYFGEDPEDTAAIANAFADSYMDTMLELRVEPTRQAAAWFDEQLTTLRADLEEAQARMTAFQQEHGIVSTDEQLDDKYTRLQDLSAQLLSAQSQAIEDRVQAASARRVIEQGAPLDQLPEVNANSYVQQLDAEVIEGEARLGALATQYGSNHPEYQRQLAVNAAKRDRLEAEVRKVLAAAENRSARSEQRVAEIQKVLDAQRDQLLDLKGSRDSLSVLMRNVDTAQSAYDTAMQRYVVSQVESRASQTNVAMLSRAVTPGKPYRPNLLLNVALAIAVGSMLGGGLVMLAEISDRRVRSVVDLIETVNVPLLGELDGWAPSKPALLPGPRDAGSAAAAGT